MFYFERKKFIFVSEYCSCTHDFTKFPEYLVSAPMVFGSVILEISNRIISDKQRIRTTMSLTHFCPQQLFYPEIIKNNLKTIFQEFITNKGDLSTAEFRIFGGGLDKKVRDSLRNQLKDAIIEIAGAVVADHIVEPEGHYPSEEGSQTDYVFGQNQVYFRTVKFDLIAKKAIEVSCSQNLKENQIKKEFWHAVDSNYSKVAQSLHLQFLDIDKRTQGTIFLIPLDQSAPYSMPKTLTNVTKETQKEFQEVLKIRIIGENGLMLSAEKSSSSRPTLTS